MYSMDHQYSQEMHSNKHHGETYICAFFKIALDFQSNNNFCVVSDRKYNFYIKDTLRPSEEDKNTDDNKDREDEDNSNNTLTLTNIVNSEHTVLNKNDLTEVKDELNKLKSALIKQEILLKEILLKIK